MIKKDKQGRCLCSCHRDRFSPIHIRPCCDLAYKKYMSATGEFDAIRYKALKTLVKK